MTASVGIITQDNQDDTWSWSYTPGPGPQGSQTVTVTATDADGAVSTTSFNLVVVGQTTPTLSWAIPAIAYGVPLSGAQLDASASVPGTFSYSQTAGAFCTRGRSFFP